MVVWKVRSGGQPGGPETVRAVSSFGQCRLTDGWHTRPNCRREFCFSSICGGQAFRCLPNLQRLLQCNSEPRGEFAVRRGTNAGSSGCCPSVCLRCMQLAQVSDAMHLLRFRSRGLMSLSLLPMSATRERKGHGWVLVTWT